MPASILTRPTPWPRLRRQHAPVLIAHGTKDRMVPVDNAHRIYANAKPGDELYLMENFGHVTLWMDYKHRLAARTLQWFDAHLVN